MHFVGVAAAPSQKLLIVDILVIYVVLAHLHLDSLDALLVAAAVLIPRLHCDADELHGLAGIYSHPLVVIVVDCAPRQLRIDH